MKPITVPLDEWFHDWTPRLSYEGKMISVFPVFGQLGSITTPERFSVELAKESDRLRRKYAHIWRL